MTYSTGFTAVSSDPYGEPLAARVYARRVEPINFTNYYDVSKGRMRPTISSGSAWRFTEDTTYSPPVAGQPIYKFAGTGGTMYVEYPMTMGEMQAANKVCFSAYVHSGSGHEYYLNTRPALEIRQTKSTSYVGTAYVTLNAYQNTFQISAGGGYGYYSGGVEYEGDGWSRVWVVMTAQTDDRQFWAYNCRMVADRSNTGYSYTYMSAPMVEAEVDTPSPFAYKTGIINHPTDLFVLSSYEKTINMNPLLRKRERDYGVIQGQKVQLEMSNVELTAMTPSIVNSWVAVQFGYPSYNLWETVYQGRVVSSEANSNLTLNIELDEAVMNVLDRKIDRDVYFDLVPWVSDVKVVSKTSASQSYNNTLGGISINSSLSANVRDEQYKIVFDTSTTYRIMNEYGAYLLDNTKAFSETGTTFLTTSAATFSPAHYVVTGANVFTMSSTGWTSGASQYVSGDTFAFATSYARTAQQLTPLGMVKHLVEDVAGIVVYDVMNGAYYDSPFVDPEFFTTNSGTSQGFICGEWKAGSRIVEMVQDALKLEHMSCYPTESGRIGMWSLSDFHTGSTAILNGNPSDSIVNLIAGSITESNSDYANIIVVKYLDVDTGSEVSTRVEYPAKVTSPVEMAIDIKWRVEDNTALTCASRALYKFNNTKKVYSANATLDLVDVDITHPIAVYDAFLGADGEKVVVVERSLDIQNQQIGIVAWNDPLAYLNVARVGYSNVGSTGTTIW